MVKKIKLILPLALLLLAGVAFSQVLSGPQDPGVQSGNRGTGAALSAIQNKTSLNNLFTDGQMRFEEVQQVSGDPNGHNGLGPRFNLNQCSVCHSQPAIGGSGAAINPEYGVAGSSVAPDDHQPYFVTNNGPNGPTVEARFPFFLNPDGSVGGSRNGGVEELFTVSGRSDANANCQLKQPPFAQAEGANDIIFRIPTPVFGDGLVENIDDSTLLNYLYSQEANSFQIAGAVNHNPNDGTITRFGWKAQNKSMHIFAGEAYNVEMGVSNLLFTQDRPLPEEDTLPLLGLPASCLNLSGGGYPEAIANATGSTPAQVLDDASEFANFMRFLAPPPPGPVVLNGQLVSQQNITDGYNVFEEIGCGVCHNAMTGTTQISNFTPRPLGAGSLSANPVAAFSDFEIHDMGTLLADNVMQGDAGGDQFRTAPLWGLGQRIFLLHDGRTQSTVQAIKNHASNGSEANYVENLFFNGNLTQQQQQDLLDFLRSL
jgi:CxxC motif-containing protein (DUF1111 family)